MLPVQINVTSCECSPGCKATYIAFPYVALVLAVLDTWI